MLQSCKKVISNIYLVYLVYISNASWIHFGTWGNLGNHQRLEGNVKHPQTVTPGRRSHRSQCHKTFQDFFVSLGPVGHGILGGQPGCPGIDPPYSLVSGPLCADASRVRQLLFTQQIVLHAKSSWSGESQTHDERPPGSILSH